MHNKVWSGNLKGTNHLEDQGINISMSRPDHGEIELVGTGLYWPKTGSSGGRPFTKAVRELRGSCKVLNLSMLILRVVTPRGLVGGCNVSEKHIVRYLHS